MTTTPSSLLTFVTFVCGCVCWLLCCSAGVLGWDRVGCREERAAYGDLVDLVGDEKLGDALEEAIEILKDVTRERKQTSILKALTKQEALQVSPALSLSLSFIFS